MTLGRPLSFVSLVALLLLASAGGCDSSEGTTRSCVEGTERCTCYANKTCNDGLVCRSKLCVRDAGAAGSASGSGGGTAEVGGTANIAGMIGSIGGATETVSTVGQAGESTAVAQGGALLVGAGGTTAMTAQGGTTVTGSGGTTVTGSGGTTVTGSGGTTVTGSGGATVIGTGGTIAAAGTTVGSGGAAGSTAMKLGPNLVSNGDFSQGSAFWHVTTSAGSELSTATVGTDEAYCISYYSGYSSQVIGWPISSTNATTLKAGTTYSFSYRIIGPSTASVASKVGLVATPYTAVFPTTTTTPTATSTYFSTTWTEVRYTFTTSVSLVTTALFGLAFTVNYFTSGQICLDDVVLAEVVGYQ